MKLHLPSKNSTWRTELFTYKINDIINSSLNLSCLIDDKYRIDPYSYELKGIYGWMKNINWRPKL